MYPVILEIGPITVYSLGLFWALGALVAVWILQLELKRHGRDAEVAGTIVMTAAVGGLIGARLLFIVEEWEHFTRAPLSMLLSGSGFSWFGGLLGGGAFSPERCVLSNRGLGYDRVSVDQSGLGDSRNGPIVSSQAN